MKDKLNDDHKEPVDDTQKEGDKLGSKPLGYLDKSLAAAKDKVEGVRAKATGSWNKVEKAFDERVSKALHRLNIPTRNDIDTLVSRVEALDNDIKAFSDEVKQVCISLGNPNDDSEKNKADR